MEGVDVAVAPLRLMIFSSMRALTDTEAVCKGGPVDSFLSNFLLSESYKKVKELVLGNPLKVNFKLYVFKYNYVLPF